MKKLLLSIGVLCSVAVAHAQVIFSVEAPASIVGGYDFSYAVAGSGWGVADLTDPINAVQDTLMLVDDGTMADSLACNPLVNDLTGKIAVLYRGACEFGAKALAAQDAGAIAVVIIDNIPEAPISMGGGAVGGTVTIPVVMITDADGATIRARMNAGDDVVCFIGSKSLYYADDIGFYPKNVLIPQAASVLAANAMDDTEFSVDLGVWLFNYGQNDQTGITMTADVSFGGSSVYSNTSAAMDILSGDSAYVTFPAFSQTSYANGMYTLTYTSTMASDEYTNDNSFTTNFQINDDHFAIAEMDGAGQAVNSSGIRPANSTQPFTSCIVYKDANASRRSARAIGFSASTNTNDGFTLDGELIEVTAYEWNDVFTDINNVTVNDLNQVGYGEYFYGADDQNVTVYQDFEDAFALIDDQRYLFCITTYTQEVFLGYDNSINYSLNDDTYLQPIYMIQADAAWSLGFSNPVYPAVVLKTGAPIYAGVDENTIDITPFPNPTSDIVNIPLSGVDGTGNLSIMDLTGKVVSTQKVGVSNGSKLAVDVSELPAGVYVFNMIFDNGATSTFNVAVTK